MIFCLVHVPMSDTSYAKEWNIILQIARRNVYTCQTMVNIIKCNLKYLAMRTLTSLAIERINQLIGLRYTF
jgi:hypothetical protein